MSNHTIAWTLNRWRGNGGDITGKVTCTAPEGSACRVACRHQCELWCDHELVDGECNAAEWLHHDDEQYCYAGDTTPLRDGPITVEWTGDSYQWRYAEVAEDGEPA